MKRFEVGQVVRCGYSSSENIGVVTKRTDKMVTIRTAGGELETAKIRADVNYRNGDEHVQRDGGDYFFASID